MASWMRRVRVAWTVVSYVVVQSGILAAAAALPLVAGHALWTSSRVPVPMRLVLSSAAALPLYLVFALSLVVVTPAATALLGWRSPAHAEMRIGDFEWPLLHWARYLMTTHVVRLFVGVPLRAAPIWTWFARWNGACVGRNVWLNATAIADHNLLTLGDDCVVGADVHLSGHTVEHGIVRTAPVVLGRGVTLGVGAVVSIGVTVGAGTQVGALSFVPKHATLEPRATYGGIPVRRLDTPAP